MKFAGRKSTLTNPAPIPPPLVFYSADRSKAVVPVLVLLFVALWYILRGDLFFVLCLTLCYFDLVFFQSFWHCDYLAWERES